MPVTEEDLLTDVGEGETQDDIKAFVNKELEEHLRATLEKIYQEPEDDEEVMMDTSLRKLPLFERWLARHFLLWNLTNLPIKVDVYDEKRVKLLTAVEVDPRGNVLTGEVGVAFKVPLETIRIPQHQELYLAANRPDAVRVEISTAAIVDITVQGAPSKVFGRVKVRGGRVLTVFGEPAQRA